MSQNLFVKLNIWQENYLNSLGFNIVTLKFNNQLDESKVFVISDFLPTRGTNILEGIDFATDFRLAGNDKHVVILSFLNKIQLEKFDNYKILDQPKIHIWQLPLDSSKIHLLQNKLENQDEIQSDAYCKEYYPKRFLHLFDITSHGKSFDLINNATGPLKSACLLAKLYPEKEFLIWNKLNEVKQKIQNEYALQQLFFITNSKSVNFIGNESDRHFGFVNLLKQLSDIKEKEITIDGLVELIDNLNKVYFQITQKYG